MVKVLFVCLGNICRSPLAEAIFNEKVKSAGLGRVFFSDSAGTSGYHVGERPDTRTVSVADKHHIPIDHFGQLFNTDLANEFDYIIAMDASNQSNIAKLIGQSDRVMLMRRFDFLFPNADVPDPYYGGSDGFEEVYQILNRSINGFIDFLKENHPEINSN